MTYTQALHSHCYRHQQIHIFTVSNFLQYGLADAGRVPQLHHQLRRSVQVPLPEGLRQVLTTTPSDATVQTQPTQPAAC